MTFSRFQNNCWIRFRDDIICLFSNQLLFMAFLRELRGRLANIWKVKVEAISRRSVPMLDIEVSIPSPDRLCFLSWKPYFKPSSKAVALSTSNCHHPSVHNWPAADLTWLARKSQNRHDFEEAKLRSAMNLIRQSHDPKQIYNLLANCPYDHRFLPSKLLRSQSEERVVTLITTYHPKISFNSFQNDVLKVLEGHAEILKHFLASTS